MHRRCKSLIGVLCCSLICGSTPMVFASSSNGVASVSNVKEVKVGEETISAPMLATIATLAVASGITLSSDDDIYDIGKLFFDYVERNNSLTWDAVQATFLSSVSVLSNGLVSVKSDFLDICKGAFSNYFSTTGDISLEGYDFAKYGDIKTSNYFGCVPIYSIPSVLTYSPPYDKRGINIVDLVNLNSDFTLYPFTFKFVRHHGSYYNIYDIYLKDSLLYSGAVISNEKSIWTYKNTLKIFESNGIFTLYIGDSGICRLTEISSFGIPYNPGSWEWDKNYDENKTETGDLPLPIPGDLGSLVGKSPSDIWGNVDNLVGDGSLTLPTVSNPSIQVDTSVVTFPTDDKSLKTPVTLNQEATILDVVVPLSFPVSVDARGVVTVADNVEVVNNSNGPIKISDVSIQSKDGWTLSDFDKDYSDERVGLKEYSFKIEGQEIRDSITLDRVVNGLDKCSISYDSNISPQKESIVGSNIADVVFTIDWYEN